MKIAYKHLIKNIKDKPSVEEISNKLFQLGHEHKICNEIYDIEFTPNRGDCLSLRGLIRDLNSFYNVRVDNDIFERDITKLNINFENNVNNFCSKISFLKVDVKNITSKYNEQIESFFQALEVKKNNFFTDISNYVSYETGQPTHCYSGSDVGGHIKLDRFKKKEKFQTLFNTFINLDEEDFVFLNDKNEVINLAGIIGSKNTACNESTKSVLIECAHFNPEHILGKTIKHNINSEAAYKFERNTDPSCHEYVLRRFLKIIDEHAEILNTSIYTYNETEFEKKVIPFDLDKINKILGFDLPKDLSLKYLTNLGFTEKGKSIVIPAHRNDIESCNDLAEEIARVIGYNNIKPKNFKTATNNFIIKNEEEIKIKNLLVENGFFEVINNPFVSTFTSNSIKVDNPLDSNKRFLRLDLRESLLENLLYNERRQKDSIKLFEISEIYSSKFKTSKRVLGVIASGRIDKNFRDFSKKINQEYFSKLFDSKIKDITQLKYEHILRDNLDSKSKDPIIYLEIEINSSFKLDYDVEININKKPNYEYKPISEFPLSKRDLSFSIKDFSNSKILQDYILGYEDTLLKEVYIFDYFFNEKKDEIKIGFRFIFQDMLSTITESQVNTVMNVIIENSTKLEGVAIPGLK